MREYANPFAGKSTSLAVLAIVSKASSLTATFVWPGNTGGVLTSSTLTLNVFVALKAGTPSSVTTVIKK